LLLVVTVGALLLPVEVDAQKAATDDEKAAALSQDVSDFALAYQLIELGRKNKAPEALITAAGLFRKLARIEYEAVTEMPEIENDPGAPKVDEPAAKAPDYDAEAAKLYAEALFLGKSEYKLDLAPLVNSARNRTEYRSPVGGPKRVSRAISPKQTHTYKVKIRRNQPVHFGFQSSAPCQLKVTRNDSPQVFRNGIGSWANTTLHSGGGNPKTVFTFITIHNYSNISGQYQFVLN